MKKDLFGWIALAVFIGSCLYMGLNRLWMKNTNLTVLISLGIAVVIVWLTQRIDGCQYKSYWKRNEIQSLVFQQILQDLAEIDGRLFGLQHLCILIFIHIRCKGTN